MGNVVTRPAIRDTEITINTLSGQAADKAIGLRDLVLGIRKGKFALFGRDGRQVIPCAGHMLNTLGAPPVVRFLSELPFDGLPMLSTFSWGTAEAFPRLPRVIWNQAILRLAQWRPSAQTLRTAAGVQEWREAWNVPRRLYMAHLDNWLLVDLDRTDHVSEIIAEAAKTDEPLTFHEAIPDTCDAWVPSTSGRHGAELVIPLIKAQPAPEGQTRSNYISAPSRLRFRPPGGDWLYLHLYARLDDHASVVAGPVLDFATHFVKSKIATDWFFVRYADPEPHIRLRLHGEPEALSRGLCRLREWADMLIEARTCSRISLETYDREIERYGGVEGIEICEKIFAADSVAVARLLSRQPVRAAEADLMRLAVVSTDALLNSLGLSAEARTEWLSRRNPRDPAIGDEFRKRKNGLRQALENMRGVSLGVVDALYDRDVVIRELTARLQSVDRLTVSLDELLGHFVHMHLNRLLGPNSRLERTAIGLAARTRRSLATHAEPP